MSERRMFAKTIIDSDAFLDMPMTSQCLYFHLGMRADDDGFVNNPKKIVRMVGASEDDLRVLISKRFLITFENGVVVIKHWKMHNYIPKDRYKPTVYQEERRLLNLKDNNVYSLYTECIQNGDTLETQDRLGKDRLGKDRLDKDKESSADKPAPRSKKFIKPDIEEVKAYIFEQGYTIDADNWYDYYESNGWMVGKNHMKDWKASIRTWQKKEREFKTPKEQPMQSGRNWANL